MSSSIKRYYFYFNQNSKETWLRENGENFKEEDILKIAFANNHLVQHRGSLKELSLN